LAPAGISTNRASGRPRHFASRLEGLQLRIRDLRRRPVSVFDRTPREPGGALFARSHAVAERLRRQPWRCHVETAKIATFSQRTCSLYPDSFLDASDRIFSRQGLKAYHTFARKMRGYTLKEKAKITAGAVTALVIVAWLAIVALALLSGG